MISKYIAFVNCYSVLTCAILIALPILIHFSNSDIPSESIGQIESIYVTDIKSENSNSVPVTISLLNHTFAMDNKKPKKPNLTNSDDQKKRNTSDILLYRKRRYLLFPEGSSFQLVYDLIIPIVDYTNYAILGITCAIAWELPSKVPSEIENDLIEKLNDGTFGLSRNDSVNNIKYIDTPHQQEHQHLSKIIYIQPSKYRYQNSSGSTSPYNQPGAYYKDRTEYNENIPRPVYISNQQKQPTPFTSTYNSPFRLKSINNERIDAGAPSENLWKPNYAKSPALNEPHKIYSQARPSRRRQHFPKRKQHAVFHIMGKRNILHTSSTGEKSFKTGETKPWLEKLDRIHLQYHRSSRHTLYSKMEIMFNKQGKNGTECILRALCETGQKRHETEPGSILVEILRAVFTLPEADDEVRNKERHPKRKLWDEAHGYRRNCSEMYPLCENFIWNSKYIF